MKNIFKITIALFAVFFAANAYAAAKYASIGTSAANVRTCGGTKCPVKFKVWKYTPVEMLGVSKDKQWVEIKDFEGFRGWIHKDLLSETPGLSVTTDANVRTAPGIKSKVAWVVQKGYSFKFLKQQGSWYQVTDDAGTTGWISSSVVWGFLEYRK